MSARKPITVKHSRGVMSKDGQTPWAAGTLHATNTHGFMSPYPFSFAALAALLADDKITEIQVIDTDNVQSTITKNWLSVDTSALQQRIAEAVETVDTDPAKARSHPTPSQHMLDYAKRPFFRSAKVGVKSRSDGFIPLLFNDDGEVVDNGCKPFTTRSRARGAAWSEWRKRCNARQGNTEAFNGERGWDVAH